MTVTILKVKYVSEDINFEFGSLPLEFEVTSTKTRNTSTKSSPCKRKQQVKWSEEDDSILRMYAEKEYSWKEIASNFLHDKFTPQQLHQRWKRVLNDNINREPWSDEEDKAIIEYVKRNGCSWSKLRTLLGTQRTDTMVRQRWLKITNGQGEVGVPGSKNMSITTTSNNNHNHNHNNQHHLNNQSPTNCNEQASAAISANLLSLNSSNSENLISNNNILSMMNSGYAAAAMSNNTSADMDVFEFIKTHQLLNQSQIITDINQSFETTTKKNSTVPLSEDSLTCDEEVFCKPRPTPIEPSASKKDQLLTPSSSMGSLLENKMELIDFHSSLQTNLEKEWLNQIFSQDF